MIFVKICLRSVYILISIIFWFIFRLHDFQIVSGKCLEPAWYLYKKKILVHLNVTVFNIKSLGRFHVAFLSAAFVHLGYVRTFEPV